MLYTSYLANKLVDWLFRGQAYVPATANLSQGLLTTTDGPRQDSHVYALDATISLTANDSRTHLYKCTTAGTSDAAQGALYPGVAGEIITDGDAVFTEQTASVRAGTAVEASYTGYARANVAASLANWSGTQGAGTTVASTGIGVPTTSNNAQITIGAGSTGATAYVWAAAWFDATAAGNMLMVEPLLTVKTINSGDPAPIFPAAALSTSIDS
jgi:hypothetical protein